MLTYNLYSLDRLYTFTLKMIFAVAAPPRSLLPHQTAKTSDITAAPLTQQPCRLTRGIIQQRSSLTLEQQPQRGARHTTSISANAWCCQAGPYC